METSIISSRNRRADFNFATNQQEMPYKFPCRLRTAAKLDINGSNCHPKRAVVLSVFSARADGRSHYYHLKHWTFYFPLNL